MCWHLFSRPGGKGGCLKPESHGLGRITGQFKSLQLFWEWKAILERFFGVMVLIAMRDGCQDLQGFVGKHQVPVEFFIVKLNRVHCTIELPSTFSTTLSVANCLCKCWHQSSFGAHPPFLGCVDFCRFYSCCYFHRCEMHSTKPRPQLLHRDAQGCTFCTELIGGLVVIPCTAILRIWTTFPALLFGLHCQFTPVGISFWRVGTAASGKLETSSWSSPNPKLPKFQPSHIPRGTQSWLRCMSLLRDILKVDVVIICILHYWA